MSTKIQLKRGLEKDLPILNIGEPAFTTDTWKLFIGSPNGNKQVFGGGGNVVPNTQSWVSTNNQDTFTITNGHISTDNSIIVFAGGVIQPNITLLNSTTFQLPEPVGVGIDVYAIWFDISNNSGNGNSNEIDITLLKNYNLVAKQTDLDTLNTNVGNISNEIGNLTDLQTTDKTNLVNAVNSNVAQLAEIDQQRLSKNNSGTVFTFIDDDGYQSFLNKWKPLADSKGIKLDTAIITGNVDILPSSMTLSQLQDLKSQGFGILSHTVTHQHLDQITLDQVRTECADSLKFMKDNNLSTLENAIVIPYSIPANAVSIKNIIREYYSYAFVSNGAIQNTDPIDSFCINRYLVDTASLDDLKSYVDQAIASGTYCVFLTHSGDDAHYPQSKMDDISALIDYIQSKNAPILTANESLKYKGNTIVAGEYTQNGVFIGRDGSTNIRDYKVEVGNDKYAMDAPISEYPPHSTTVVNLSGGAGGGDTLTLEGGTMTVVRSDDYYSYATFMSVGGVAIGNFKLYYRKWVGDQNTGSWGTWKKIYPDDFNVVPYANTYVMDASITSYAPNSTSVCDITGPQDNLTSEGGTLTIYRGNEYYSYATFVSVGGISTGNFKVFYRKWVGSDIGGAWGSWLKIADFSQQGWQTDTLWNGWTNNGGTDDTFGYTKDMNGIVRLKGTIKVGTSNAFYQLPAGYRPLLTKRFAFASDTGIVLGRIESNGNMFANSLTGYAYISLDGLNFKAEQ